MITILNVAKQPIAVLENYFEDEVNEQVNGAYTLRFSVYLDDDKSQYIQFGNIAECEGQWFNIVHHRRTRSDNGNVAIAVECEQVGYDLLFTVFEGGFIHTGYPSVLLNMALAGTGFTVGSVAYNGYISVDLKEGVSARAVLMEIATQTGCELYFDKYTVNLLDERGQDRGVQFRLGKNLRGIVKDVNGQSGEVLTAYEVDVVELNTLPEFEGLEYFELGDTVQIIDEELGINEEQRIIEYSYSPKRRINSRVVIANYIRGIQDAIYRIQTSTVGKDKWMYGVKIGPSEGIVQERYDKLARSVWNADEFRMQVGDGSGSYDNAVYFDPSSRRYIFNGTLEAVDGVFSGDLSAVGGTFTGDLSAAGGTFSGDLSAVGGTFTGTLVGVDGTFSGTITASTIVGSSINNGNGTFSVSSSGHVTASSIDITGGNITGASNINLSEDVSIGNWLYLNASSFNSGVRFASGISISYDPAAGGLFLDASGGIYANGVQIG